MMRAGIFKDGSFLQIEPKKARGFDNSSIIIIFSHILLAFILVMAFSIPGKILLTGVKHS
jgi:hypothetical protein